MNLDDIARLIAPLHAQSWKSTYRGIMSDQFLDFLVDADRREHWQQRVRALAAGEGEIFLARVAESPVGFLCIEAGEAHVHGAYVNNLHVLPETKGHGIGTALLQAGEAWARAHGQDQLYLYVYEDNVAARAFYRSHGWHAVERLMSELPDGALAAELRMIKKLA